MAVYPHTVDIVVKDMTSMLAFYRLLGLAIPDEATGAQCEVDTGRGYAVGFLDQAMVAATPLGFIESVGQRMSIAFRCDTPAEVDATHARVSAAGHPTVAAPWDAPWDQRYASVRDPDGNRVDLFAPND